jgi:drug/metabolite transporter (DMT)-like permease
VLIFIPIYIATEQSKNIYEKGDGDKDTNTNTNVGDGKRKEGEEEAIKPMLLAGLELALWNFGAQGFVTAGLLSSPAARASFLTQTCVVVVMTPLLSALAGEKIKSSVWGGCVLALCGLFLISTTTSTGDVIEGSTIDSALSTINVSQGDVLILDTTWSLVMVNVYLSYVKTCKRLQRSRPSIHKDGIVSSNVWWMVFVYCRNDNFIRHISGVERSNNTPLVRME